MCRWLVPSIAVLSLLAGCGGQRPDEEIVGGTTAQRDVLRAVLRAMPTTRVERFELRGETLDIEWAPPRSVRARWEGFVVAGAFRDRLVGRGLPEFSWVEHPEGGVNVNRWAMPVEARHGLAPLGRAMIAALLAPALGAAIAHISLYAPLGHAVVLVLRVDDPASFLRHRFDTISRWLGRGLDGHYVRVEDRGGDRVFEVASAHRLGAYSSWVRPDLAGCSPIVPIGGPLHGRKPPPCPAKGS